MQTCHPRGGGRGPLALGSITHRPAPIIHRPSTILVSSPSSSNARPSSPTPSLVGRTAQTTSTAAGCVYLLGTTRNMDRRLHSPAFKTEVSRADAWIGPALSTLCVCHEGVASVHLSVSKERHVCGCVCLCLCVCMYVCIHSSHHMAPPPSRVASSSTCNSKKHKGAARSSRPQRTSRL